MIVVDDQLLFGILARKPSPALEAHATTGVATTSSWYFRLARAIATGRVLTAEPKAPSAA